MSYEKQTWASGDVITAEKLNHIEDGIESGGEKEFVVLATDFNTSADSYVDVTLNKTFAQIKEAIEESKPVAIQYLSAGSPIGREYTKVYIAKIETTADGEITGIYFYGHRVNLVTGQANIAQAEFRITSSSAQYRQTVVSVATL